MDKNLFKLVNLGVCSYYLIVYSCFQFYAETFSLTPQGGFALILWAFGVSLLTLTAGVFFFFRYRKGRAYCTDDAGKAASEAVGLTGGSIILVMMLLHVIHSLCYYNYGALNLFFNPTGPLFSILFFMPFIVIAAVTIGKGLKVKGHGPLSDISAGLCFPVTLLFVLYTCIHELVKRLMEVAAFQQYESGPQELIWICVQLVLITAALILFFAPLNFKMKFEHTDQPCGKKLTGQSLVTCGFIILINTSINILNFIISILVFLITDSEEFIRTISELARERFVGQLLPELIFLIIGLTAILYGNKKGSQS